METDLLMMQKVCGIRGGRTPFSSWDYLVSRLLRGRHKSRIVMVADQPARRPHQEAQTQV